MNTATIDRVLVAWRTTLPPEVSPAYFDGFLARNRPRLEMLIGTHLASQARACDVRQVEPPPRAANDPDDLKSRVLQLVHRLLEAASADMHEIVEALQAERIEVTPDLLRSWLFHDPYIRFSYSGGEFYIVPSTPQGGPPPWWVHRTLHVIDGQEHQTLACDTCQKYVLLHEDPWQIRHRDLCPRGPAQFAAHKLPRIEKLFDDLNRRARRLGVGGGLSLKVVREFLHSTHIGKHDSNDPGWYCDPSSRPTHWADLPYVEVTVEGEVPKIPGWKVLGVLQHATEEGEDWTILRDAPGSSIPARYRAAKGDCEHCGLHRSRKETVILEDEHGKVMQVGRSCLADYTGSSDAEARIKAFVAWQETWAQVRELMADSAVDEQWALDPVSRVIGVERFLAWVAGCVREYGFVSSKAADRDSEPTGVCAANTDAAAKAMEPSEAPRPSAEDLEQAREALAWARENLTADKAQTNFDHNLAVIVARNYVDHKTIHTAPWIFQKWRRARFPQAFSITPKSEWRPEAVGDKVKLRLTVKRVLPEAALTKYGYSDLYVFIDDEGRELKLFTTAADGPDEGDVVELTAEVRKKDEVRGQRQTMIAKRSRGWTILNKIRAVSQDSDSDDEEDDDGSLA